MTKIGCSSSGFKCDNDQCIPLIWKCDDDEDCLNGEDEESCLTSEYY